MKNTGFSNDSYRFILYRKISLIVSMITIVPIGYMLGYFTISDFFAGTYTVADDTTLVNVIALIMLMSNAYTIYYFGGLLLNRITLEGDYVNIRTMLTTCIVPKSEVGHYSISCFKRYDSFIFPTLCIHYVNGGYFAIRGVLWGNSKIKAITDEIDLLGRNNKDKESQTGFVEVKGLIKRTHVISVILMVTAVLIVSLQLIVTILSLIW